MLFGQGDAAHEEADELVGERHLGPHATVGVPHVKDQTPLLEPCHERTRVSRQRTVLVRDEPVPQPANRITDSWRNRFSRCVRSGGMRVPPRPFVGGRLGRRRRWCAENRTKENQEDYRCSMHRPPPHRVRARCAVGVVDRSSPRLGPFGAFPCCFGSAVSGEAGHRHYLQRG